MKMSEELNQQEELQLLLKSLVDRVKNLEAMVYSTDNILMKSGLVRAETSRPTIQTNNGVPDADVIAKMDWSELDDMVKKFNGE
tara:strand:+ start:11461 stop:11712 length:252 start_codon:yes stop_codon:yes gene_type:complete